MLHDPVLGIGRGRVLILRRWNSEEKDRLQTELRRALCFSDAFCHRQLEHARHAADLASLLQLLAHEHRENEIVRGQLRLADEITHSWRMPKAPWAMHQFSHLPRLSGRPKRRKPTNKRAPFDGALDAGARSR